MPTPTCVFNDEDEDCDDPLPFDAHSVTYTAMAYVTGFENEFGYVAYARATAALPVSIEVWLWKSTSYCLPLPRLLRKSWS